MIPLAELSRQAKLLGKEEYLKRHPTPALVLATPPNEPPDAGKTSVMSVQTPVVERAGHESTPGEVPIRGADVDAPPSPSDLGAIVYFLAKSDRNPFSAMITLGRARNNDVVIESALVSKVHAYFTLDPEARVCDQGSTNGTVVNGRRLGREESSPLADGARIELGTGIVLRFYTAEGLFALLTS